MILAGFFMLFGFFTLQPNEARVLVLFGEYRGTVRRSGFHWGNPFYSNGPSSAALTQAANAAPTRGRKSRDRSRRRRTPRNKISLRARNLNGERLKVNDKRGNPIEIAAVVVWRVQDTAQAMFDVDDYENYVTIQSESALRHLASQYAYDHGEENEITLRSGVDEVSQALTRGAAGAAEQGRRGGRGSAAHAPGLRAGNRAGDAAPPAGRGGHRRPAEDRARRRQHGGDGACKELAEKHVVQLDDERKAAMVSNLMVVLCGESEVHPVVNTGTLYT